MPEGRLIKNRRKAHCFKNTEMRLNWKDMEVASRCTDMELKLTGKEGDETISN